MSVDVSIIIPSLGRLDHLRNCIEAILSQDAGYKLEIIVVIDGSGCEDAARLLASEFGDRGRLLIDVSHTRRGSAKAKNIGARMASGKLLVFLDDDTIPTHSWLTSLVESYSIGIVGVGGSERKGGPPSIANSLFYSIYGGKTGRITKSGLVISNFTPKKRDTESVDCLPGCNMSFRKEPFIRLGGFDENYVGTAYREETDFCVRVKTLGELLFVPAAMVDHLEEPYGGNSPSSFRDWNYWYHRNNTYFYLKNFGPVSRLRWLRHYLVELHTSLMRMLVQHNLSPIVMMRSGIIDGRRALQESRG